MLVSRRSSQQLHADGHIIKWASSCVLVKTPSDSSSWSYDEPAWRYIVAQGYETDTQEHKLCAQKWPVSVFTDTNLRNLTQEGAPTVVDDLSMFIDRFQNSADDVHPNFKPVANAVLSAVQGIVRLSSPVPLKGGGSMDDVAYVWPSNATSAQIFNDLPKLGRFLVSKIRRDPWWTEQYDVFCSVSGSESVHGPRMIELCRVFLELSDTLAKHGMDGEWIQ